ncbi:MAG: DUF2807 domain-containing protein [Anaerolineae bacterium]|nr:DUF2807 domain-containing protein [Anaerolineae bacterium]
MKGTGILVLLASFIMMGAAGCTLGSLGFIRGSGHVVEETFEVQDFTGVTLAGIGTLSIEQGETEQLRVEAEDNLIPYIETEIHNGALTIRFQEFTHIRPTRPINFFLTVKALEDLTLAGSGDIIVKDLEAQTFHARLNGSGKLVMAALEADHAIVAINGSGNIEIATLTAAALRARSSGSGDIDIAGGTVTEQDVTLTGSGNFRATALQSDRATIHITGGGNTTVRVRETLNASIAGSGSVRYVGTPAVESRVTGSGRVRAIEG